MKFGASKQGSDYLVAVGDNRGETVHQLSASEFSVLVEHAEQALAGSDNEHISKDGGRYKLTLPVSDRCSRSYFVHRRDLVNLKTQLMGV